MSYKIQKKIAKLSSKHSGIFFLLVIIAVILTKVFSFSETSFITIFCFFLISTLGVSHGSLDNFKGEKLLKVYKIKHKFLFYFSYIFLACSIIIIWKFLPSLSLLLFLMVASYHFGKEDTELFLFTNYAKQRVKSYDKYTKSYYFFIFFKGFLIITAPLFFHYQETQNIFKLLNSNFSLHEGLITIFFYFSIYAYIHFNFVLESSSYGRGATIIDGISIVLLNYFFSPLIAFTFYFCFLHSVRHSISLISTLDKKNLKKGTQKFIKKALPLTLITAIFFIVSVYFLINYYVLDDAILKVIFIGLASLTFPHILLEYLLEKNEK
jgi:Brp/Blh family beta-carotene 15,15'-monooxygenase